jgi:eukaryotic-like serine/threonine-protein kinase
VVQVVGGRYALIAHLGGGAVSDVSLAKIDGGEPDSAKVVVVKRLKFGADAEPKVSAQFAAEASLAMQLNHPNIAQALEASADDDGPFLVLEYLEGVTLARLRSRAQRRAGGLPRAIVLHIVTEVATGLAYAHALEDQAGKSLRLVHRDLSPENILVTYEGTAKLIDFGVALAATPAEARAGGMKGNLAYMAPEQARPGVTLDARADVFALGVVLWELLAGKRMWEGLSEADVLARLADETPLHSVRTIAPDVTPELDAICVQALAKVRDDRVDSAFELREAIDKASTAPELRTTTREVAELVSSLFEDEREKMRALVAEAVARPAAAAASLPRLSVAPPPPANAFVDADSDPSLPIVAPDPLPSAPPAPAALAAPTSAPAAPAVPASAPAVPASAPAAPAAAPAALAAAFEAALAAALAAPAAPTSLTAAPAAPASAPAAPASAPAAPTSAPAVPAAAASAPASAPAAFVEIVRFEDGPSRDRRFAYVMGAAVVVAFAAVAIVAMTRSKDDTKNDDGVVARRRLPATEPIAKTAPPAVSAEVEPAEITVEIRVTPAAAHVFVDGVKAPTNPHRIKLVRGRFMHEIRAEADGFLPYSTTIAFDRDRTLDIALPTKPYGASPPRATTPSSSSAPTGVAPSKPPDNPY